MRMLLYTPQTAGTLLIAQPENKLEELTVLLTEKGNPTGSPDASLTAGGWRWANGLWTVRRIAEPPAK